MCERNFAFALPIFEIHANIVHPVRIDKITDIHSNTFVYTHTVCSEMKSQLNRAFERGYET